MLAQELSADLLLLDERLARNVAHARGIPFRGVRGVLIDAKRAGLIERVAPVMAQLLHFGFFIDHTTFRDVQQQAGE